MKRLCLFILMIGALTGCANKLPRFTFDREIPPPVFRETNFYAEPAWTVRLKSPSKDVIAVNDSLLLITTFRGELMLVDLKRGRRIRPFWKADWKAVNLMNLDRNSGRMIFSFAKENKVVAYSADRGENLWKAKHDDLMTNAVISGDSLITLRNRRDLIIIGLEDGAQLKSLRLEKPVNSPVFLYQNRIFFIDEAGQLNVFSRAGKKMEVIPLELSIYPVAGTNGHLLVAADSRGAILVFDMKKRRVVFSKTLENPVYTVPVLTGDVIVVVEAGGLVSTLSADTGELQWQTRLSGLITDSPVVLDDMLLLPFKDGRILGISTVDGQRLFNLKVPDGLRHIRAVSGGIAAINQRYKMLFYPVIKNGDRYE